MSVAVRKEPPDYWFFAATILLVIVGVILVFDASYARAADIGEGDSWFFVKKQIVFAIIGILAMFVAMRIHPKRLRSLTYIAAFLAAVLLVAVRIPGIGKCIGGGWRWIPLGPFHLQPSEFAKLAVVMYLAHILASKGLRMRNFWLLATRLLLVGLLAGLVMAGPDMGTTAAILLTTIAMLFAAGVRKRHLAAMVLVGLGLVSALIFTSPYRTERVMVFLNPSRDYYGSGYQITHSLIAHGTGGLTGQGFCEGREKRFIPAPETDMVVATLAEEGGFVGMMALLGLFVFFTGKGLSIAHRAKSSYMKLLAIGITSLIGLQALMNIGVATASIPATGVPLPFISYGGSYLIVMLFAAGIVLSISQHQNEQMDEPELRRYENHCNRRRDRRASISCVEYRPRTKTSRSRTPVRR